MGRKKIKIAKIADERNRQVTFTKRKNGLMKKAMELSMLCDCDVVLLIYNANKKMYQYSSTGDVQTSVRRLDSLSAHERRTNADYNKHFANKKDDEKDLAEYRTPTRVTPRGTIGGARTTRSNSISSGTRPTRRSSSVSGTTKGLEALLEPVTPDKFQLGAAGAVVGTKRPADMGDDNMRGGKGWKRSLAINTIGQQKEKAAAAAAAAASGVQQQPGRTRKGSLKGQKGVSLAMQQPQQPQQHIDLAMSLGLPGGKNPQPYQPIQAGTKLTRAQQQQLQHQQQHQQQQQPHQHQQHQQQQQQHQQQQHQQQHQQQRGGKYQRAPAYNMQGGHVVYQQQQQQPQHGAPVYTYPPMHQQQDNYFNANQPVQMQQPMTRSMAAMTPTQDGPSPSGFLSLSTPQTAAPPPATRRESTALNAPILPSPSTLHPVECVGASLTPTDLETPMLDFFDAGLSKRK